MHGEAVKRLYDFNDTLSASETFYSVQYQLISKREGPVFVVTENTNPIWILIVCLLTCNS